MKELEKFILKEKQKTLLNIFMILCELSKTEDIISFTYNEDYLIVNDYYRIHLKDEEEKEQEQYTLNSKDMNLTSNEVKVTNYTKEKENERTYL